ncbi:putative short-chain dehydrogenase [Rhizodiscina lignyota]|uniref:Short-chain dehydrogenase n=1 Tax=Rhizodiscina lignyota TaxID=1504668 RepID=A0A9P4IFQ7_9PEZI|nr:putative short-chain dehydrogenase [Rhizodiscina lignyota]
MAPHFYSVTTSEDSVEYYADKIKGKVILTTGVHKGGLGGYFVEGVAKQKPKTLVLAGRDLAKVQKVADAIKETSPNVQVDLLQLDLSSQEQVRKAAAEVNAKYDKIDVLVNNAAVMSPATFQTTKDGLELQFGTNHIGHFLFTNLILNKILAAGPGARVVTISSDGLRLSPIRWDDMNFSEGKTYNRWYAYGQSKTATNLFTVELAKRYGSKGLLAFNVHPGVIAESNLGRHNDWDAYGEMRSIDQKLGNHQGFEPYPYKSMSQGAATHIYAAFEPSLAASNGAYLQDCGVPKQDDPEEVKPYAMDPKEAEKLWKYSEKVVGQTFD